MILGVGPAGSSGGAVAQRLAGQAAKSGCSCATCRRSDVDMVATSQTYVPATPLRDFVVRLLPPLDG